MGEERGEVSRPLAPGLTLSLPVPPGPLSSPPTLEPPISKCCDLRSCMSPNILLAWCEERPGAAQTEDEALIEDGLSNAEKEPCLYDERMFGFVQEERRGRVPLF